MDLGNATLSWYRLFVSSAHGEVPKVDLGNATLSWYRSYRLHTGRFQSGPWECHVSSARGRFQRRTLDATLSWYRLFAPPARRGGPKVDLGTATLSWYRVFVSSARREVPKVDLGNATLSWYRVFVSSARREVPKVDLGNATLSWYRLLISPARGEVPKVDLGIANKQTRHESWKPFQTPWDREKALNFSPRAGGRRTMVFLLVVSARMRFGVPLFWLCFRQPRRVLQARVWYLRIVGAICEGRRSVLRTSRQAGAALFGRGRDQVKMSREGEGYGQLLKMRCAAAEVCIFSSSDLLGGLGESSRRSERGLVG